MVGRTGTAQSRTVMTPATLYLVRAGVLSPFVIYDNLSNATTVLWATFQTHDAVAECFSVNFKNHSSISSEYVKFLASNSGMEAVGQLT
jgi:hypothetical protein